MLVVCLGDVMLDVIVDPARPLEPDDDVPASIAFAAGGQPANVATWVVDLGGTARVFGPRSDSGPGHLVETALLDRGVELWGSPTGRSGTVLSLLADGTRTMASDPGDLGWLAELRSGAWLDDADWLYLSGYALLRTADPRRLVETVGVARAHGSRIAVDLASRGLISDYGAEAFAGLCRTLRPAAVFATDGEWALAAPFLTDEPEVLVLKHGSRGASFVADGTTDRRPPEPGAVIDVTGAGDALAAGYLMGGPDLAMATAARCVARRGAQP